MHYYDRVDIKNAKNGAKTHKLGLKQGSRDLSAIKTKFQGGFWVKLGTKM